MTKRILIFTSMFLFAAGLFAQGQEDELRNKQSLKKTASGIPEGWTTGGNFGLNLDQLLVVQPRSGAGDNKLSFGGLGQLFGVYKNGRFVWDNNFKLQEGLQRIGKSQRGKPFEKTLDMLEFYTKPGYALTADEKWYAAINAGLQSQLLRTYPGNVLKDEFQSGVDSLGSPVYSKYDPISQFFSPAQLVFEPGIEFKPNEKFSALLSPAAIRYLIVANDVIADDFLVDANGAFLGSRHGNPMTATTDSNGAITVNSYENGDFQLGAALRALYKDKFLDGRVSFSTGAYAFYNYLGGKNGVKNLPIFEWTTSTGFEIWKGIGVAINTGLYYDYLKPVSADWDSNARAYQTSKRGAMFTEQILLTYSKNFGAERKKD